jgi:hypothetical protein
MAKKPEPPQLFWLTYRHPDGRAPGAVVIESRGLLHARFMASLSGADRGLEFASGQQLDSDSAAGSCRRRRSRTRYAAMTATSGRVIVSVSGFCFSVIMLVKFLILVVYSFVAAHEKSELGLAGPSAVKRLN